MSGVLHGLRVVAALKRRSRGHEQPIAPAVLHGLRVVAALKLDGPQAAIVDCRCVLHGLRVVAALKLDGAFSDRVDAPRSPRPSGRGRIEACRSGSAFGDERRFSTAFGSWPH